jgi:hypothetical protein
VILKTPRIFNSGRFCFHYNRVFHNSHSKNLHRRAASSAVELPPTPNDPGFIIEWNAHTTSDKLRIERFGYQSEAYTAALIRLKGAMHHRLKTSKNGSPPYF